MALPRGDEGQLMKALKIKDKSALLQADCYHSLLPRSSRQLLATRRHSGARLSSKITRPRVRRRERWEMPGSFGQPYLPKALNDLLRGLRAPSDT